MKIEKWVAVYQDRYERGMHIDKGTPYVGVLLFDSKEQCLLIANRSNFLKAVKIEITI